jgi:hypothetical protein
VRVRWKSTYSCEVSESGLAYEMKVVARCEVTKGDFLREVKRTGWDGWHKCRMFGG